MWPGTFSIRYVLPSLWEWSCMVLEVVVISHVGLPLQYLCLGLTGHISPNKSIFYNIWGYILSNTDSIPGSQKSLYFNIWGHLLSKTDSILESKKVFNNIWGTLCSCFYNIWGYLLSNTDRIPGSKKEYLKLPTQLMVYLGPIKFLLTIFEVLFLFEVCVLVF